MSTHYAIVPAKGTYASSERVRPIRVCSTLEAAREICRRFSASYRRRMRRHGYSTDGYRVVACNVARRTQVSWLGWWLDGLPSLE